MDRNRTMDNMLSAVPVAIAGDAMQLIGETPLVRLDRLAREVRLEAEILIKLEYLNPFGSLKDRVARRMVDALEAAGRAAPERTVLVEATTGSLGISLAHVAARRGARPSWRPCGTDAGGRGHPWIDHPRPRNCSRRPGRRDDRPVREPVQSGRA
jgi:threonine synthase